MPTAFLLSQIDSLFSDMKLGQKNNDSILIPPTKNCLSHEISTDPIFVKKYFGAKKYAAILSELRRNLCLTKNPFETNGNLTVTIVTC